MLPGGLDRWVTTPEEASTQREGARRSEGPPGGTVRSTKQRSVSSSL